MQDVNACLVCDGVAFVERYSATFEGDWSAAVPYFLTRRAKAVHGRIVSCRNCGFTFTSPQFTAADYARIYASVNSQNREKVTGEARFAALADLVRKMEKKGRFLDFGCGNAGFLDAMPGFEAVGFEVAEISEGVLRRGNFVTGHILAEDLSTAALSKAARLVLTKSSIATSAVQGRRGAQVRPTQR